MYSAHRQADRCTGCKTISRLPLANVRDGKQVHRARRRRSLICSGENGRTSLVSASTSMVPSVANCPQSGRFRSASRRQTTRRP